ncbi:MAG: hypothetical protein AAFV43_10870 [Planctomycetota bacterium]
MLFVPATAARRPDRRLARRPRRGRARRLWLIALVVVVGLLAMAPTLIATTASHNTLLAGALPAEAGVLTARSTVIGWTGPLALTGVELRDPQGGLIATAERAELPAGWTPLVVGGPIDVVVTNPIVYVTLSTAGSNLEAFAARLEANKRAEGGAARQDNNRAKRPVRVRITGGQAQIADAATGEQWLASQIEANVSINAAPGAAGEQSVNVRGALSEANGQPGTFVIEQTSQSPALGQPTERVALDLQALPASLIGAVLRRDDPAARVTGVITGGGEATWNQVERPPRELWPPGVDLDAPLAWAGAAAWKTKGQIAVSGAAYQGRLSRGEVVRLANVTAPWEIVAAPPGLVIKQLAPTLDFVRARLVGQLSAAEGEQLAGGALVAPESLGAEVEIDLARLAAIAPGVLSVRDGVRIDSGKINATVGLQRTPAGARLTLDAKTDGFSGASPRGPLRWPSPVTVDAVAVGPAALDAARPLAGWRVETLNCQSRFLAVNAKGDATQLEGAARLDLAKLATDLGQFVDLGSYRLAGSGEANFRGAREAGGYAFASDGRFSDVLVGAAERPLVQEDLLNYAVSGRVAGGDIASAVAQGSVDAGGDTLTFEVAPAGEAAARDFRVNLNGLAPSWYRRVRLVRPGLPSPEDLRLAGAVEASAAGRFDATRGQLSSVEATIVDFTLAPPSADGQPAVLIREPQVELSADAAWEPGRIRSSRGTLRTTAVSLSSRDLEITPGAADGWRGEVAFRADLARLSSYSIGASEPGAIAAAGAVTGKALLRGVPEGTRLEANATGESLQLLRRQAAGVESLWSEPRLTVETKAMVRPAMRGDGTQGVGLDLEDLRVASETVTGSAGGSIADVERLAGVRLSGGVQYDLEKLSPVLWPQLADSVRLFGKDTARFQINSDADSADTLPAPSSLPAPAGVATPPGGAAPSGLASLTGRIDAPWQGADLFGLAVGPGKLGATLGGGVLRVEPIRVRVGDAGQINAQAAARLAPPPRYAELAPGPLVTDVSISQEVSERVLKFIAPVLADATRADGRFSISLAELRAPIDRPELSRARGQLDVHSVQVLPGPSIAELVQLVRQIRGVVRDGVEGLADSNQRPIVTMSDRVIDFTMADGRIYHRGLEFFVGDALVTSEGSVGVDETLDLLVRVPIQEAWVQQRPVLLGGLRGQSIDIPVGGTFDKPEIDRDAFRRISRDLLQSAAQGALDGLLRGLLAPR